MAVWEAAVKKALLSLCVLSLVLVGCGYSFRGGQNNLPADVRSIAVPVFANNTAEVRIETIFTDAVISQFTRSQMVRVVPEGEADAILRGTLVGIMLTDVSLTTNETSRQRRVTIIVSASLVRVRDGKVLWQDRNLRQNRTYLITGNNLTDEGNKRMAITELAADLAESMHDRVFENF